MNDPSDLLDTASLYSEEERLLAAAVRHFVVEKAKPLIGACYEEGRFPLELVPEMAALGLFGMLLGEGPSAAPSATAYGLACAELEAGDSALRSFVSVRARSRCTRSPPSDRLTSDASGCRGYAGES